MVSSSKSSLDCEETKGKTIDRHASRQERKLSALQYASESEESEDDIMATMARATSQAWPRTSLQHASESGESEARFGKSGSSHAKAVRVLGSMADEWNAPTDRGANYRLYRLRRVLE